MNDFMTENIDKMIESTIPKVDDCNVTLQKGIPYANFTKEFYDTIRFDVKEVFQGSSSNRIKTVPIIVLGTTGIGKTTFARNVIAQVQEWYREYGVCPVYTNEVSLSSLMEHGLQMFRYIKDAKDFNWVNPPSVYVLIFDDATAVPVRPEEVRDFFSMRHKAEEYTGITEGIIYSLFLTHDWYSLNKIFRRFGQMCVVLSVPPLDIYARRQIGQLLGKGSMQFLAEKYKLAFKEDKYKGTGLVKLPYPPDGQRSDTGLIEFKSLDIPYVVVKSWSKPQVEIDLADLVLHIPKEKKAKEKGLKQLEEQLEKIKAQQRIRTARCRAKQKEEFERRF
jgi:hypothetical protein